MNIEKTLHGLAHLFVFGVFVFLGSTFITPQHEAHAALSKRVFLTSGTSWTVPADWSDVDTIETIGGGGHGGSANVGGGGGGGGAYASISNLDLTAGASVTYRVIATSDTVFNTTATTCAGSPTPSVCAKGGTTASGSTNGTGGTAAASVGTVKYSGSDGASWGGNAAGPNGAGQVVTGYADAGFGGFNGDGGFDFCPDLPSDGGAGGVGYPGYEYSTTPGYGSGGGGGVGGSAGPGAFSGGNGGNGGNYGGGAGGGGARCDANGFAGSGGNGAGGLIIITYTSTETGSTSLAKFKIKGGRFLIRGGRVQIR
ncbi:MAG: exported hypothetical protein [Parcubacteria group bacterium Greene0714_7]|nr:MAG: exported hypothetical protein [Parcubacteria group bacterium Greene0714_7]